MSKYSRKCFKLGLHNPCFVVLCTSACLYKEVLNGCKEVQDLLCLKFRYVDSVRMRSSEFTWGRVTIYCDIYITMTGSCLRASSIVQEHRSWDSFGSGGTSYLS
jgi:hypothetical protein